MYIYISKFTHMYIHTYIYIYMYKYIFIYMYISRWAYHATNPSWYSFLEYSSPSMVHHIFENVNSKMVVVPLRLWLPLFRPRLSRAVLAQEPGTPCYKLASQPAVPESRGWQIASHSRDGTTTILLSKFSKCGVPYLGMNILARCTTVNF